jgi:threonyl-tRNA synthetase
MKKTRKKATHATQNPQGDPLAAMRHSCAHLLAAAVLRIWPDTKLAIGPSIEDGFYYDFEFSKPISEADLPKIEKMMRKTLKDWKAFSREDVSIADAKTREKDQPYKLELIEDFSKTSDTVSFYTSGHFTDLCRGGHIEDPQTMGPFKLLKLAGAYWRGDEKNTQLTRIYGTCFATQEALDAYLHMLEEAKKRDHKKLGRELELFFFHNTAPGMAYWLPKGTLLYNTLVEFWREEHKKRNYQEIVSPLMNKKELYVTSGHFAHYWSDMFTVTTPDDEEYGVKAMNCPNAMVVFGFKQRSYKDLPLRLSDTDNLHRFERSGTLNGLLRVRQFRQDDAHCFVTEDQIQSEYKNILEIVERFYSIFGLDYSFRLGTRPESFMGDAATWDRAEKELKEILEESGKAYSIAEGDGAFYGPKIDILMKDSLGRPWQMGTIQLDFQQPRNFALEYTDQAGKKQTPIAIHRVVYGSLERFIGIITEHFSGAFPTWLAPVQVAVLPISDKHADFARKIHETLFEKGIRSELHENNETIGLKILNASKMKIPYMLIVGDKEIAGKHESYGSQAWRGRLGSAGCLGIHKKP